ncbi:MAG TPA: hypothetical protein PKM65_16965 [Spirochaetota bacterium]|nr:hypothetical protein [Spirochaetota bacterium]HNT12158.1 hypothetical protein [Spirochaetota bacterium]HNV45793.1 hypothetical protein [Spirochaetota bacterium]HPI23344.1 hypothetical protein [Spirochaetota bacterium]HPU89301.1 hypothetical protein [Spirochaetota bacterium]
MRNPIALPDVLFTAFALIPPAAGIIAEGINRTPLIIVIVLAILYLAALSIVLMIAVGRLHSRPALVISRCYAIVFSAPCCYISAFTIGLALLLRLFPNCTMVNGDIRCTMATGQIFGAIIIAAIGGSALLHVYYRRFGNLFHRAATALTDGSRHDGDRAKPSSAPSNLRE